MLTIASPNTDRSLLTLGELRVAIGLGGADTSQDTKLTALGLRVSANITAACRVATAAGIPPTLRAETVVETIEAGSVGRKNLILARTPVTSITTVVENGTTLTADDYRSNGSPGLLARRSGSHPSCWARCCDIVVTYVAGWATVPDDLKGIASQLAAGYWLQDGSDLMEKQVSIPGVIESQRWVDVQSDAEMPDDLMAALERGGYVNAWVL